MPALSLTETLLAFGGQGLVLSGAGVAAQVWRRRLTGRGSTATGALLLGALTVAALGYAAFWIYFAHPLAGKIFSWAAMGAVIGTLAWMWLRAGARGPAVHGRLLALTAAAGVFYIAALLIFPGAKFTDTAGQRFIPRMPGDNEIPRIFAERLYIGMSPKGPGGDWLSSDRPPLQTGIALITMPALRAAGIDFDVACATAGVWFQLLWIPALWCFLLWLGLAEREAHAGTAMLGFTGFLLFNTIFTWPKLGGAALVLLAFCTFFGRAANSPEPAERWRRFALGGALAGFGALAHGGVMFSLLALAPLALLKLRERWSGWLCAGAAFALLLLPWMAYQKFYEPPGNRLVKWHIGGVIPSDQRTVTEALRDSYRDLGWSKAWAARRDNLMMLLHGEWKNAGTLSPALAAARRTEESAYPLRAVGGWVLGLGALVALGWQAHRGLRVWRGRGAAHGLGLAWLALTLLGWVGLMFFPKTVFVHQGSLVTQLVALGLLTAWTLLAGRWAFAFVGGATAVSFAGTWLGPSVNVANLPAHAPAIAVAMGGAAVVLLLAITALWPATKRPWRDPAPRAGAIPNAPPSFPAWWRRGRLTWWLLAGFALLLFLRKPHALHTPQLYAEDGTIFLGQNDFLGLRVFAEPYMGYLHTLPRLIAWAAAHTLDPAWWPLAYNGAAFLLGLAVLARIFSPRVDVPHKPALALAIVLACQTGEIFSNITNLQWLTAVLLIVQALIARPSTLAQRAGDLVIVTIVGLTGPFVIALAPLLAWRWWRERNRDTLAVLLVATACAAVQSALLLTTGPQFVFPAFNAMAFLAVVGQRLVVGPLVGDYAATHLPPSVMGVIGALVILGGLAWVLRSGPRRLLRAQIVAAFALMMVAVVYRSRPDTWGLASPSYSDRYFFLPRVLLWWLLVLEIDTTSRWSAWTARALCGVVVVVQAFHFTEPPPQNYRWAEHCEPIRRGVPANLPTLPEGWTLEYRGRPSAN
ncbi:MAG: hypothetical protein ABIQ12_03410 [Opitutaceae bacterium]